MFIMDSKQASTDTRYNQHLREILEDSGETVIDDAMDTSDIMFMGRSPAGKLDLTLGFELKATPNDLVASLRDGRLASQLSRLTQEFDACWLVTYGEPVRVNSKTGKIQEVKRRSGRSGSSKKWVDSAFSFHYLNSLIAKFEMAGGRQLHCESMEKVAMTLLSYHAYWRKESHESERLQKKRFKFTDWAILDDPIAQMYAVIVGPQRALTLKEYYPTLEMLCIASRKDMISRKGIGGKTYDKIQEFVRGKST